MQLGFASFLLSFARQMDMDVKVDIYEPRNFAQPGPDGCNMCSGVVSESLVQALAFEGITRHVSKSYLRLAEALFDREENDQEEHLLRFPVPATLSSPFRSRSPLLG